MIRFGTLGIAALLVAGCFVSVELPTLSIHVPTFSAMPPPGQPAPAAPPTHGAPPQRLTPSDQPAPVAPPPHGALPQRLTPSDQPAPVAPPPHGALPRRTSFTTKASLKLKPGVYRGDFTLASFAIVVEGAGPDQTIIEGNLIIQASQTTVKNLAVLGDVVIKGSQNKLLNVDYRGAVHDGGLQNRY